MSWKINYCDDVRGWYYQHPCQSSLPPSGSWTTEGYLGEDAEPAPRVHRCIEVGDEVRAVEVSEVPWCQCPLPRLQLLLGASFTVTALRGEWFQARSGQDFSGFRPFSAIFHLKCAVGVVTGALSVPWSSAKMPQTPVASMKTGSAPRSRL